MESCFVLKSGVKRHPQKTRVPLTFPPPLFVTWPKFSNTKIVSLLVIDRAVILQSITATVSRRTPPGVKLRASELVNG